MKLESLSKITDPVRLEDLDRDRVVELQTALAYLGYPVGDIDGIVGPRARAAWGEFKADVFQGHADLIGPGSIARLREEIGERDREEHDFTTTAGTIAAIISECRKQGIGSRDEIAYVLATTRWETANTFRPVREAFWMSEDWRRANLRYYPYYGRGYVQLTWERNYRVYGRILGVDIVSKPDLVMEPNVSLFVLVHGFKTGTFTGRKISDYINDHRVDFHNARRCINGIDRAAEIAALAVAYRDGLSVSNDTIIYRGDRR